MTRLARHNTYKSMLTTTTLTLKQLQRTNIRTNLAKTDWFNPLSLQQVQALLTLFSKSFSSFPHGTCLLSGSNSYLAWDEIYHPICAPIPRNVTRRTHAVYRNKQTPNGTLTLNDSLFQEHYACSSVSNVSWDYNPKLQEPQFPSWAYPCSFAITRGILFSFLSSAYLYA